MTQVTTNNRLVSISEWLWSKLQETGFEVHHPSLGLHFRSAQDFFKHHFSINSQLPQLIPSKAPFRIWICFDLAGERRRAKLEKEDSGFSPGSGVQAFKRTFYVSRSSFAGIRPQGKHHAWHFKVLCLRNILNYVVAMNMSARQCMLSSSPSVLNYLFCQGARLLQPWGGPSRHRTLARCGRGRVEHSEMTPWSALKALGFELQPNFGHPEHSIETCIIMGFQSKEKKGSSYSLLYIYIYVQFSGLLHGRVVIQLLKIWKHHLTI